MPNAAKKAAKQTYKQEKKEFAKVVKATPKHAPKNPERAATKAAAFNTAQKEYRAAKQNVKAVAPNFKRGGSPIKQANKKDNKPKDKVDNKHKRLEFGDAFHMFGNALSRKKAGLKATKEDKSFIIGPGARPHIPGGYKAGAGQAVIRDKDRGKPKPKPAVAQAPTTPAKPATPTTPAKPATPTTPTKPVTPTTPKPPVAGKPVQGKAANPYSWTKTQGSGGGGNIAQGGAQGTNVANLGGPRGTAGMSENRKGQNKYRFI